MTSAGYRIIDEPSPGPTAHLAVSPMWPLFALMFGGAWLAFPWFVFNAYAIGSFNRRKELGWAIAGLVGAGLIAIGMDAAFHVAQRSIPDLPASEVADYARLLPILLKLLVGYVLFVSQSSSFELHQHFGGRARNGMLVVVAGYLLRPSVVRLASGQGLPEGVVTFLSWSVA
jgi:hypothetical protein